MTSRTRLIVLSISAPVIVFAIVGGFLGKAMAREDTYQGLKMFDDVTQAITSSYVEPVDVDKVMNGAMRGLADGLDADSAYLSPEEVKQAESGAPLAPGDIGVELTRQYYLRIIAARDNSPASKAGLRTGDYVRMIDNMPTRDMSVWEGMRALRGAPGSKVKLTIIRGNAVDPHIVELTREAPAGPEVTARMAAAGVGYVRIAAVGPKASEEVKARVGDLQKNGATRLIVDVRSNSSGSFDAGITLARLFIAKGTLTVRESRVGEKQTIAAAQGDGSITLPTDVLIDTGTSGAAELFASAMAGNQRAELFGEHTIGRAATQKLIKLPDGSGLWLSTSKFLTPNGGQLHEKGLEPTVAVDQPDVEFGQPPPAADPILDKALEHAATGKVAGENGKKAA
jgi:carboxyl-terminal processing protease